MTSPQPERAYGIILLGASHFPYKKQLEPKPAFAKSKQRVESVLTRDYLLADRVDRLDLFDLELSQIQLIDQVHNFIAERPDLTDIVVYYCGHGGFLTDRTYYLALRATRDGREATTGLLLKQFRLDLEDVLADKRTYLLLDCCYAASAVSDWLSDDRSVSTFISEQLAENFSPSGTALLVASSRTSPAVAPEDHETTLFSGHLAEAIRTGLKSEHSELSLVDVADTVKARIRNEPQKWRVMPELHVPRQQSGGDVSRFPLVRNIGMEQAAPAHAREPSMPSPAWPTLSYSQTFDYRIFLAPSPPAEPADTQEPAMPATDKPAICQQATDDSTQKAGEAIVEAPRTALQVASASTDPPSAPKEKSKRKSGAKIRTKTTTLVPDSKTSPGTAAAFAGAGNTSAADAGEKSGEEPTADLSSLTTQKKRRWTPATVTACAVLLVVLGGTSLYMWTAERSAKDPSSGADATKHAGGGVWTATNNGPEGPIRSGPSEPTDNNFRTASTDSTEVRLPNATTGKAESICNTNAAINSAAQPMGGEYKPVKVAVQPDLSSARMMRNVVLSPAGDLLASAGDDGYIRLWDTKTLSLVKNLPQQAKAVFGIAFNADGTQLASAGYDKTIRVFDAASGKLLKTFADIDSDAEGVAFSPDKPIPYLLGGFTDGRIGIWNLVTGKLVKEVTDPKGKTVRAISFAPDGSSNFISTNDGTLWLHAFGRTTQPTKGHSGVVYRATHSPDGRRVASVGSDNKINIWRARDLELVATLDVNTKRMIGLAWADDNARVVVGGASGTVQLWDVDRRVKLRDFVGHQRNVDVEAAAFLSGGRRFVTASEDGTLRLWDVDKSESLLTIVPFDSGEYIAYTAEGCYAASSAADRHFKMAVDGKPTDVTDQLKNIFLKTDGFASLILAKSP